MQMECCGRPCVAEDGFAVCTSCGKIASRHLETSATCFSQSCYFVPMGYTRKARFVKKVLGALQMMASHNVIPRLMRYLKKQNINSPVDLLNAISVFPTKGRRPYSYAMYYWKALGHEVPQCTDADVRLLTHEFDEIFFAWERLKLKRPKFPYAYLFRKLVQSNALYSDGARKLVPFMRALRCSKRRQRYDRLFLLCKDFEYKKIDHILETMEEKIDENEIEYPEQEVTREVVTRKKYLSPFDVKNVYKTKGEMDRAVRRGDFNIGKTMHMAPNGDFYFLAFDKDEKAKSHVSMSKLSISEQKQMELQQTQNLNSLLRAQSLL